MTPSRGVNLTESVRIQDGDGDWWMRVAPDVYAMVRVVPDVYAMEDADMQCDRLSRRQIQVSHGIRRLVYMDGRAVES